MRRSLILAGMLAGGWVSAQEADRAIAIPGTNTLVQSVREEGTQFGFVSRDRGRTWRRQGAIDTDLHLRFGTFDPLSPPHVPTLLRAQPASRLFVVQFRTPIVAEFRAYLRGLGVEIHHYLPSQSYLVRMDPARVDRLRRAAFVRAVLPYHPAFRLEPAVLRDLVRPDRPVRYTIVFVDKRRDAVALQRHVADLGGEQNVRAAGGILFEATLRRRQLLELLNDDRVLWIERSTGIHEDIDLVRTASGSAYIDTVGSINGVGVVGHLFEGVHSAHTEFASIGGVRSGPWAPFSNAGSDHGTNVAGILFARGSSSLYRGLVPNGQLVYTNQGFVMNNTARYGTTRSLMINQKIMFDVASWGYATGLAYTARSAEMDDLIFDLDLFVAQSQGNEGATSQPSKSNPQAWAKNICSVGGFQHRNNTSALDDYWGKAGSSGPAADGRFGVTLTAMADAVGTAHKTNTYRADFSGTSAAAAIVAGLGGNMIEMFTDGKFGYAKTTGRTAPERFKVLPHFTTTKALLVATANQLPFDVLGTARGANRYQQGFGFPNVRRAYDQADRLLVIDELDRLRALESRTYYVFARGGRFNAVMTHADPAAAANATIHRVNSVDLSVVTSDGTQYHGNYGLTTRAYNKVGGTANDRDTIESVQLFPAPVGLTLVTVRCTAVRKDAVKQTPAADVDYALVVDGIGGMRDQTGMRLDLDSTATGDFSVNVTNAPTGGWTAGFTLFSITTSRPLGTGNVLGVEYDSITYAGMRVPSAAGNVFRFKPGTATQYPRAKFSFPTAFAGALKGTTIDAVVMLLNGPNVVAVSNVDRVTIK